MVCWTEVQDGAAETVGLEASLEAQKDFHFGYAPSREALEASGDASEASGIAAECTKDLHEAQDRLQYWL